MCNVLLTGFFLMFHEINSRRFSRVIDHYFTIKEILQTLINAVSGFHLNIFFYNFL